MDHAQVFEHCQLQVVPHLTGPAGLHYDTLAYGIVAADRLKVQGWLLAALMVHMLAAFAQHSTAQHSTAQHSTAQHSTAQHSTAQHSTAQHSTAQLTCTVVFIPGSMTSIP